MNKIIDSYENRITILYICIVLILFAMYVTNLIAIKKCVEIEVKDAKLEQQVKDYEWQLEQVKYIFDGLRGE